MTNAHYWTLATFLQVFHHINSEIDMHSVADCPVKPPFLALSLQLQTSPPPGTIFTFRFGC